MSTLRRDVLTLPTSPLGPPDPLPPLRSTADLHVVDPGPGGDGGADEEMRRGIAYGRVPSVLPYLQQSAYGRELVDTEHAVAVLENDRLRAAFLLGWGGRLWSLVDLATGRELLHRPATLQLANLALRDAWFAGGVEWNLGLTGHTALTCEPLHASRVLLDGDEATPLLRLHEYERMRGLVYQVDAWLPDGSPHLLVHVTVTNPTDATVPFYWWSNTAVPEAEDVRVLTPAASAWTFGPERLLRHVPMPVVAGVDRSYPTRSPAAVDFFFDLAGAARPWIAAVDGRGAGLVQTSTHRLRGRKLFVWGDGPGGRHWQQWLAPRGGRYLEIQAGVARTQLEHLPMPAGARWSWLETYGPLLGDPDRLHHPDWAVGAAEVEALLQRTAPAAWCAAAEARARATVDRPPVEQLQQGSGWGALERRRRQAAGEGEGDWSLPGTPFGDETLGPEQRPWLDLLAHGDLDLDLDEPPSSYQVAPDWHRRLATATGPAADLLRGVAQAYAGDAAAAEESWRASAEQRPNAWAERNLGLLLADRDVPAALAAYGRARELAPDLAPLVVEQLGVLLDDGRPEELLAVVDALPPGLADQPTVRLREAQAAVAVGDVARAGRVLEPGLVVPQVREGAQLLEDLWYGYRALVLAARGTSPEEARLRARQEPLPAVYDFSMTAPAT